MKTRAGTERAEAFFRSNLEVVEHIARLKEAGLSQAEIKRLTDPMESFHLQLQDEVASYERLKRGEFAELDNLRGLGHLLIAVRIAQGVAQQELAQRLNVHESQVSRDERNEYVGITLERAVKILDALNVRLRSRVELTSPPEMVVGDRPERSAPASRPLQVRCRKADDRHFPVVRAFVQAPSEYGGHFFASMAAADLSLAAAWARSWLTFMC